MKKKKKLFVYGTLKKDEMLLALLGRIPPKKKATLSGYSRFIEGGYIFLKKDQKLDVVSGFLIEVDEKELELMNLWEEVPLYTLRSEVFTVGKVKTNALFYSRDEIGIKLADSNMISSFSDEQIIKDLSELRASFLKEDLSKK